jgi:outer membrane immunogenic protein
MKKIVLAALIVVAGAVSASAADMPARTYTKAAPLPPPCIWCGFYIGLNGGWVGSSGSNDLSSISVDPGITVGPVISPSSQNSNGGFGGGQIGYNWVFPGGMNGAGSGWLVGVEADIQGASLNHGSRSLAFFGDDGNVNTASADSRLNWFGTLRGRLGFTSGPVLFYGTGGFAFGGVKNTLLVGFADDADCNPGTVVTVCSASTLVSSSSTRTGWVAGAGIEWMFAPNWSVKGEYQHINLGSVTQTGSAIAIDITDLPFEGNFATRHVNETFNTVRVGVNYHFGGPILARY